MPLPGRMAAASRNEGLAPGLRRSIEALSRDLAEAEGALKAMTARRGDLVTTVGLAKGRTELKPKVDAFLERIQEDHNGRVVARYENLLNLLVGEVFPEETRVERSRIVLKLTAESSGPGLDVLRECDGREDEREDAFDDNGGALTNVLSLGLRLIAAVRSRTRRFILLDEADCWIKTGDKVSSFYGVLREAAGKLGVQCLAISHHDVADLGTGAHVVKIKGHPNQGGTSLHNEDGEPPSWESGRDGIRWVRFHDFQGFVDARLDLAPGLTGVIGPNNRGKSSIARAFRGVFYGELRDSLIRHGALCATVEFGLPDGRFLRFSRHRRRNPKNIWSLHEPDGSIVFDEASNFSHETSGRDTPAWVNEMFLLGRVEDLDVHLSNQKTPVFLLNQNAAKRAAVLSVGQEGSYIQAMQTIHRQRCREDAVTAKTGEREIGAIDERLKSFVDVQGARSAIDAMRSIADEVEAREREIASIHGHDERLKAARGRLDDATARHSVLDGLPGSDALPSLARESEALQRSSTLATRLEGVLSTLALAEGRSGILSSLPAAPPSIDVTDAAKAIADAIERTSSALLAAEGRSGVLSSLPAAVPDLDRVDDAVALAQAIVMSGARLADVSARFATLSDLPLAAPTLASSDTPMRHGMAIKRAVERLGASIGIREACATLPDALPSLQAIDAPRATSDALERARERLAVTRAGLEALLSREGRLRSELEALVADSGGCPACGQPIRDLDHLLGTHAA